MVWTALYALMGQASYLVWQHGGFEAQQAAFLLYGIQLLLNLLWPIIFFKLRRIKLAQAENVGEGMPCALQRQPQALCGNAWRSLSPCLRCARVLCSLAGCGIGDDEEVLRR